MVKPTPNIIANVEYISMSFMRCGRNLNKVLKVVTLVARNANEAMLAPMVQCGGGCSSHESEVKQSVLCWRVWDKSGFSHSENFFSLFNDTLIGW
jgi:hypothetical protein